MKSLLTFALIAILSLQVNAQTWNLNYSTATTSEQIVALSAPNDYVCWFLTNFDKLYKTVNGGVNWTIIPPTATSFNPSGLYVIDENLAFKSSSQNLFRTTDGGLTWTSVFTGSQFSPPVIQMKDSSSGVVTSGGILFKTNNGGVSWNSAVTQPPLIIQNTTGKGSVFSLGDELWVTQQNGGIAYSPNFGSTWSTPSNTGLSPVSVNTKVAFANTNFGIATKGSVSPYIYVTTDGGNNWTNADNSLGANEDVVADGTELWYIPNSSDHFYVKNSINGGSTWQIQLQLSGTLGFNILEKSRIGHIIWAGTAQGKLYKYTPTQLSIGDVTISEIKMYPNPASNSVYFDATDLKNITLFNALGVRVASKEINTTEDNFIDISSLPNGIYISRVTSIKGQQCFKLVIQN